GNFLISSVEGKRMVSLCLDESQPIPRQERASNIDAVCKMTVLPSLEAIPTAVFVLTRTPDF
ncbi:MAG: hypothetical protein KDC45_01390, partial [Bacteroidetes bacterium]|nr:hypothetical protein [Bacteroidota bacterium]